MPSTAPQFAPGAPGYSPAMDRAEAEIRAPRPLELKRPASWRATYKIAVEHIRAHRPMTAWQVADGLGWSVERAKDAVARAKELSLLAKVGKAGGKRFIYGAVQQP